MKNDIIIECYNGCGLQLFVNACLQLEEFADKAAELKDRLKLKIAVFRESVQVANECIRPKEVLSIITQLYPEENLRKTAVKIFTTLDKYKAELSADSCYSLFSAIDCIGMMGEGIIYLDKLYEGHGILCEQGKRTIIPQTAVITMLQSGDLDLCVTEEAKHLIHAEEAAFYSSIKVNTKLPPEYTLLNCITSTQKDQEIRLFEIKRESSSTDTIMKLESNIDDSTAEAMGYVLEHLLQKGALDVFYTPIYMKKNRPSYLLTVLCRRQDTEKMEEIIFLDTTTIGIRKSIMKRRILQRKHLEIETTLGTVKVKECTYHNIKRYYPEYESIAEICRTLDLGYQDVFTLVNRELTNAVRK
ncbi:MAG: nickel insertion protein [Lachnospiraceae bacterium]